MQHKPADLVHQRVLLPNTSLSATMNQIIEAITGMQAHLPRTLLARFYSRNERLLIGAATLLAFLLAWETLGGIGFIDPLVAPTSQSDNVAI